MSVNSKMTAIADAIRAKTGGTGTLTLDQMAVEIEGISGGGGLTLTVIANEGATVTVTKNEEVYTSTDNPAVFNNLSEGVWSATAEKNGDYIKTSIELKSNYTVELKSNFFGISRDVTASNPAWTRTGDAVGMNATASIGTVAGVSDFDDVYPWSKMKRETLSTGDVMVKIPKFWFQRYREGNVEHIKIAGEAATGFALHPAFKHGGVERDHIYVGAYKTSSNNKSVTGSAPQGSQTRAAMRSNAKNKGAGWSLIDISALSAIQMLMLVEFADNNMQAKIGRGYCDGNSGAIKTGSCDNVPNLTGKPAGTDGKIDVIWRGIEGLWGSVWEWVDGLNFNGGTYYVCNDISKYADDTAAGYEQLSYTGATNWASSYITEEGLDTGNNPHVIMPKAAGSGSETTFECDACWSTTGWRVFARGGYWEGGSPCGLFTVYLYDGASASYPSIGSRLLYLP